jgi:hypothetical protein
VCALLAAVGSETVAVNEVNHLLEARRLSVAAALVLSFCAAGFGSCNSKSIDTVAEARQYVDDVIDGAKANSKAASGAGLEVQQLVGQADRIEDIRKLYDEAPGVVCDGLSAADTTGDVLGPSRAEIVAAIRSDLSYRPEDNPAIEEFVAEVQPGDTLRRLTRIQMIELGDSLCSLAEQL